MLLNIRHFLDRIIATNKVWFSSTAHYDRGVFIPVNLEKQSKGVTWGKKSLIFRNKKII